MPIRTILLDVGGVLLTNGWDRKLRALAVQQFSLDAQETEIRHQLLFEDFERGKITFKDYLKHLIFFKKRAFTLEDFQEFIFSAVKPYPEMLTLMAESKAQHSYKLGILSNEGQELAIQRFQKFPFFKEHIDFYIVSGFVGFRKPDPRIYQLALNISQTTPQEILYIDDRATNLEPAKNLGIQTICHINWRSTQTALLDYVFG